MKMHLLRALVVAGALVAPLALAAPAAAEPGQALRLQGAGQVVEGDFGFTDYDQGTYWETRHVRGTVQGSLGKGSYYVVLLYRCEGYQPDWSHTRSCTESWSASIETKRGTLRLQSESRPEAVDGPVAYQVTEGTGQFEGAGGSGSADVTRELLNAHGRLTLTR
jgi:hypothetical protein